MSFLRRLFGNSDPLEPLRRAASRSAWAELLARGEELDKNKLDEALREELETLLCRGGDALAEINLSEAEACLRSGDTDRAVEHLSLAAEQAHSDAMRLRIAECRLPAPGSSVSAPKVSTSAGCAGCSSDTRAPEEAGRDGDLDDQTRMELILSSYPPEWRDRYCAMGSELRGAFFLSHEGRVDEALKSFESVSQVERDDLFHYERGTLLARMGDRKSAVKDLQDALSRNPDHLPAQKTLIDLELSAGETASAESRVRALLLSTPEANEFCHGRLCAIEANRNNPQQAIEHGLLAASGGDPRILILTASLLEKTERLGEAEALLSRLPGGGCSGANLALAEFWARHSINPDKALGAFKGALRQDPENPRWLLRIAQVYVNRGWKKDALPLLEGLVSGADLEPELAQQAQDLLGICRSNGNA